MCSENKDTDQLCSCCTADLPSHNYHMICHSSFSGSVILIAGGGGCGGQSSCFCSCMMKNRGCFLNS